MRVIAAPRSPDEPTRSHNYVRIKPHTLYDMSTDGEIERSCIKQMLLLTDVNARQMLTADPTMVATWCQNIMAVVVPAQGGPVCSSAYPLHSWCSGIQVVCASIQHRGLHTLLNFARFQQNGSIGAVLKPECLQAPFKPWSIYVPPLASLKSVKDAPVKVKFRVSLIAAVAKTAYSLQILGARHIPRPSTSRLPVPFALLRVLGIPSDTRQLRTGIAQQSSAYALWHEETMQFDVLVPSIAMIVIEIYHSDSYKPELLCAAAISLPMLRQGCVVICA